MPDDPLAEGGPTDLPLFSDRAPSGAPYLFPGAPARARSGRSVEPGVPRPDRRPGLFATGPPAGPAPPATGRRVDGLPPPASGSRVEPAQPRRPTARPADPAGPVPAGRTAGRWARATLTEVVGVVDGEVRVEQLRHRYRAVPALLVAAALATVTVAVGARPASLSGAELVRALLGPLLAGGLAAVIRRVRPDERFSGPGQVRRFRLRALTGGTHRCLLVGEARGGAIRSGSIVRVTAGRCRRGQYPVRRIDLLATTNGPVTGWISGRAAPTAVILRWADRLCQLVAALTVLWSLLVLGGHLP